MTAADRLDEIARMSDDGYREDHTSELVAALRAVLAEHRQAVAYGVAVCDTCSQVKDADEWDDPDDSPIASWLPWPCPTVAAITTALDVTP
ncbi:MAG TPA: hypothetical protein VMV41_01210 [Cellulomonadaceae bacterium]|nr:hypothetical protein [Cellulomonadaceae bacterium]